MEIDNYNRLGVSHYYSEPIKNSKDPRITIQSLRQGSPESLSLSEDTYGHVNFLSQEHYFGLQEYIRTEFSERKIPTYIFDQHTHALFAWYEANFDKKIKKGATLIHIDEHDDADYPLIRGFEPENLTDIASYTKKIQIYNFIAPALENGLIKEVIWVRPLLTKEKVKEVTSGKRNIAYCEMGIDNEFLDRVIDDQLPAEELILDIDIDYFRYSFAQPKQAKIMRGFQNESAIQYVFEHDLERTKKLMHTAGVITIATSPGYIDQTVALPIVRQLFQS